MASEKGMASGVGHEPETVKENWSSPAFTAPQHRMVPNAALLSVMDICALGDDIVAFTFKAESLPMLDSDTGNEMVSPGLIRPSLLPPTASLAEFEE
jgi:hypothetical protein